MPCLISVVSSLLFAGMSVQAVTVSLSGTVRKTGSATGLSGVNVRLANIPGLTATTDTDGAFSLSGSVPVATQPRHPVSFRFVIRNNSVLFFTGRGRVIRTIDITACSGEKVGSYHFSDRTAMPLAVPLSSLIPGIYLMRVTVGVESFIRTIAVINKGLVLCDRDYTSLSSRAFLSAKQAAQEMVDTIIAAKSGYTTKRVPVDTYNKQDIVIEMDSGCTIGCSREGLECAVARYLDALKAGNPGTMPLAPDAQYIVNDRTATLAAGEGLFAAGLPVDFYRSMIDLDSCATFTEVICASAPHQYVLGVRLDVDDSLITKIYTVETDEGDWLFDADNYLTVSRRENWGLVPEAERLTREQLDLGARAYFEFWGDKDFKVPWGDPCARLEGGMGGYDGKLRDEYAGGTTHWGSCSVGVPEDDMTLRIKESLVDRDYGMVVLFLNLGGTDSHLYRIIKDESLLPRTGFDYGIRYVHTLTEQR
ncbi:MAG: carboxypeptidase regulatory-like domain-containing protein [Chitinispirillaceae bacterium]|nr:carboxypeptidase regulatory-like domain-containing protein [Chitinispirillaceae bacterium]